MPNAVESEMPFMGAEPEFPFPNRRFDPVAGMKACKTRGGLPARVVCIDRMSDQGKTIVALVEQHGQEFVQIFYYTGHFFGPGHESENDLVNL